MSDRSGKRMAVFGKSGSGKSNYVMSMIADFDRVVVFDPEEEFGELKGFLEVGCLEDLIEALRDCWEGSFRVAYVPSDMKEEEELHDVSRLIERMQARYKTGQMDQKTTLVVDELNLSFPLNPKPAHDGFARLCSKGRKRGINIIGVTQRPAEVATRFRGNLDRIACFDIAGSDIEAVTKSFRGEKAPVEAVMALPKWGYVFWENGDWKAHEPI